MYVHACLRLCQCRHSPTLCMSMTTLLTTFFTSSLPCSVPCGFLSGCVSAASTVAETIFINTQLSLSTWGRRQCCNSDNSFKCQSIHLISSVILCSLCCPWIILTHSTCTVDNPTEYILLYEFTLTWLKRYNCCRSKYKFDRNIAMCCIPQRLYTQTTSPTTNLVHNLLKKVVRYMNVHTKSKYIIRCLL